MRHIFFLIGILLVTTLSACSSAPENNAVTTPSVVSNQTEEKTEKPSESNLLNVIKESREKATANEKSARLQLKVTEESASKVSVSLRLENPLKKDISAVRAFLAYNPEALHGVSIDIPQDSPFQIIAPGENIFDAKNGLLKIGVSASEGNVFREESTEIATIRFDRKEKSFTSIDFYGFGKAEKTVVLEKINDNTFQDILQEPVVPTLPLSPQS